MKLYVLGWLVACAAASVLAFRERRHLVIARRAYWHGLLRRWKLITFAIAFVGMIAVAPRSGDPTWDAWDAGFMSILTFLTAPWTLGVLVRAARRQGSRAEAFVAACVWCFSASWSYDAYLSLRDGAYPATWAANFVASSGLYAAGGAMWSLAWREGRGLTFAFLEADWPASLAEGSFRRVAPFALVLMALVLILLAPFLWLAYRR